MSSPPGCWGLEGQATALAATVTRHTAAPELQQFAARMRAQAGDAKRMRELMGEWHQPVPASYSPGASLPAGMMGTGMMHAADWARSARARAVVQPPLAGRHDQQLQRRNRAVPARTRLGCQPAGPRPSPHHAGGTAIRTRPAAAMALGRADGHDGLSVTLATRSAGPRTQSQCPVLSAVPRPDRQRPGIAGIFFLCRKTVTRSMVYGRPGRPFPS